mmetsp:Transcript_869/g.1756  ORF Transcript_869/g.1756 Transcript_869/m.1756 type:complete len:215 (+) Transcript_869:252-896(+)
MTSRRRLNRTLRRAPARRSCPTPSTASCFFHQTRAEGLRMRVCSLSPRRTRLPRRQTRLPRRQPHLPPHQTRLPPRRHSLAPSYLRARERSPSRASCPCAASSTSSGTTRPSCSSLTWSSRLRRAKPSAAPSSRFSRRTTTLWTRGSGGATSWCATTCSTSCAGSSRASGRPQRRSGRCARACAPLAGSTRPSGTRRSCSRCCARPRSQTTSSN